MLLDIADRVTGRADALTPPRTVHFVGGGDYRSIGNTFLTHFRELAQLSPRERVLDIGCGTGRIAVPLLGHLGPDGAYTGFDVSKRAVAWCRDHISTRNDRFRFVHADVYNLEYKPDGISAAEAYRFPAEDGSIDFAFATSVFTHMHGREVLHYMTELWRVLRPGGRALLTFFLYDGGALPGPAPQTPALEFRTRWAPASASIRRPQSAPSPIRRAGCAMRQRMPASQPCSRFASGAGKGIPRSSISRTSCWCAAQTSAAQTLPCLRSRI